VLLQLFQDAVFVGFIVFKAIFILIQVLILFRQNTEISSNCLTLLTYITQQRLKDVIILKEGHNYLYK
jgi:hypothetical protein